MIRLFYVSTATAAVEDAVVTSISDVSQRKNADRDVTGALAFDGRSFGQVLEGDEQAVLALMNKIKVDPRHTGIIEVGRIAVDHRAFYDWGMKRLQSASFNDLMAVMV